MFIYSSTFCHTSHTTMKRIRRGYRLDPLVDSVIKLLARETGSSESDLISCCILAHATRIAETRRVLAAMANSKTVPGAVTTTIRSAQDRIFKRWEKERKAVREKD